MRIFDRVDPRGLENREWHLWLLAIVIIFVFAVGIALLMYPAAFTSPINAMQTNPRETFFGFCAMAALSIGYLIDRHLVISRLRKKSAGI